MLPLIKLISFFLLALSPAAARAQLTIGFYNKTFPSAEALVQQSVATTFSKNPGLVANLIRMFFHDCFVRGCDGSVLIDSTSSNKAEKDALPNNPSLRGFQVIVVVKSSIEANANLPSPLYNDSDGRSYSISLS